MKKILLLFVVSCFANKVAAQEMHLPQMNQYLADNEFLISSTYAGIGDYIKLRLGGVTQWVGIKDAPDYQSFAGDVRIGERSGVGLVLYNDKNGYTKQMGGKVSFAHHLTLDRYDNHFLSFGISYALNSFRIDIDKFTQPITDPSVTDNRSNINHNFDVGVLYRYKGWFANLTVGNILNKDIDIFAINEPRALRNYQVYAGYRYKRYRNSDFEIEPSMFYQLYESDGRSSTDLNVKFRWLDFEDYYWVGVNYRFLNDQILKPLNVGPMAGLKKSNFYFAYSYQVMLNELVTYNSGTHVITIGIDLFQGISNCRCTHR
ncbi:MAG: type IX secretion system membrane protein PorP/SprF [Capnocytophaga sp.]|nr:type IX secretion system membrane protein PorP/SprF [Capnocytophaga sp.]